MTCETALMKVPKRSMPEYRSIDSFIAFLRYFCISMRVQNDASNDHERPDDLGDGHRLGKEHETPNDAPHDGHGLVRKTPW